MYYDDVEEIALVSNMTIAESSVDSDSNPVKHAEVVILAPFLLLAVGALLRQTTKALPVPYTMQLLIVGTLLGILLRGDQWTGTLQQSMEVLGNLDPHLMIHVFLPPLIFESAASLEWHLLTKAKWHIISLAGPGLLLASSLTGGVLYSLLSNSERFQDDLLLAECSDEWSYHTALLLGVIMSATDPVAVVALLNDLGCKASLSTTIEGESLLNDGTALVMFTILIKLVEGDSSDGVEDYVLTFGKMSIGGALFGTVFAIIMVQWLRMIFNDALAEISVTLAGAYLCFFVAEYFLHVSGVIAVVCLGLYFGHSGRTSVSPEVAHFLEEFWQCLGFIGNTLIFVVAGTVIGFKLPSFPVSEFTHMFAMYAVCALIRGVVIGLIYLAFKACGSDLEFKDQIVATW
jgi:NhaP-type Na+/H+ or K+/H+ antiporter